MADVFKITAGSRLHFGPLAWKPDHGRDFGGWGVMLETPRTVVRVGKIGPFPFSAATLPIGQLRADDILHRLIVSDRAGDAVRVVVDEEPPPHCGFGTGTQLALSVAAGVARLQSGTRPPATELAARVGRGLRSAVGIHGFDHGGLIVDSGKLPQDNIGLLAAHADMPCEWRFVLLRPLTGMGLTGDQERAAFRDLPPFGESLTQHLQTLVFDEIVPSVLNDQCPRFAEALDEYGVSVGEAFRAAQGGVVHASALAIWTALRDRGIRGIAQTSWGPTLAVVCSNPDEAQRIARVARSLLPTAHVDISAPRNRGAEIIMLESAPA